MGFLKYKLPAIAVLPPVLLALTITERHKPRAKQKSSVLSLREMNAEADRLDESLESKSIDQNPRGNAASEKDTQEEAELPSRTSEAASVTSAGPSETAVDLSQGEASSQKGLNEPRPSSGILVQFDSGDLGKEVDSRTTSVLAMASEHSLGSPRQTKDSGIEQDLPEGIQDAQHSVTPDKAVKQVEDSQSIASQESQVQPTGVMVEFGPSEPSEGAVPDLPDKTAGKASGNYDAEETGNSNAHAEGIVVQSSEDTPEEIEAEEAAETTKVKPLATTPRHGTKYVSCCPTIQLGGSPETSQCMRSSGTLLYCHSASGPHLSC